jgi:Cd2+/Zn2+-exporting ATPase
MTLKESSPIRDELGEDLIAHWRSPIEGMDCADCARTIERSLADLAGVRDAKVRFAAGTAEVTYRPQETTPQALAKRVSDLGYRTPATAQPSWAFAIEGMDCADCAQTVEAGVRRLSDVAEARVNFAAATLVVVPASAQLTSQAILDAVDQAGYRAQLRDEARSSAEAAPWWKRRRVGEIGLAIALWIAGFTLERAGAPTLVSAVPFLAAMLLAGYPVVRSSWFALKARRADMNLLMTIAAAGAVAIGEWDEGATVLILFAVGITLQTLTLDRTRRAVQALLKLAPAEATVRRDGVEQRVLVSAVGVGETLIVRPGERVPLDGVVIAGSSAVDQSPITGESVPAEVQPDATVYAGSINGDGVLDIRTTKIANETMLARIGRMVEEAQASRAPAQAFVDRFAAIYTPIVIAFAIGLATIVPFFAGDFREWFFRALVLLVVACPCALVISTPVALVSAIGSASLRGVLFKGGAAIEGLAHVRAIAFDKTGTLTAGRPVVTDVIPLGAVDRSTILSRAAAVEAQSTHPIAHAINQAAQEQQLDIPRVQNAQNIPGRGARAEIGSQVITVGSRKLFSSIPSETEDWLTTCEQAGNTAVLVGAGGVPFGIIAASDPIRPESAAAIRELDRIGVHPVMLTGDNRHTADRIARQAGVRDVRAELLPEDKVAAVRALQARYPVAMIGDGINDAPALATASVGIAMGAGGTDVAIEAADVALMGDNLLLVPATVRLARQTVLIIRQNVTISILTKVVFLALTFVGVTNLWMAVLADTGMSLVVTANSLRLLRFGRLKDGDSAGGLSPDASLHGHQPAQVHDRTRPEQATGAEPRTPLSQA